MRAERPLRVPLQIGTSALSSLALTAMYFAPGSLLVAAPVTLMMYLGITDVGEAGGYILFPGVFMCGMAWKHLLRARRQRPSDLLLTSDGFEIRGGPNAGKRLKWSDVTQVSIEVPPKKKEKDEDDSDLKELYVYRSGSKLLLASADRKSEQRSLLELSRTLQAGRGEVPEYEKRVAAKEDATALLVCPSCAAAVAPADAETVVCSYCKATVPVGEDVRRRLRDAVDVAKRPDAAVAKLLDQPGAGFVTGILSVAALFMLSAWPAALVLATLNYLEHAFTLAGTGYLLLFVAACVVGFFGLIRGRLVDRQALRLVALDFGAIPPSVAGQPYLCRRCLAPLNPNSEQVLVSCVYCQSENVLGIDLRRDAKVARAETESLGEALKRRISERRRWRGVSFVGVGLLVLSGYSLRNGIGHNALTWPLEQKCKQGELAACVQWADLISVKDSEVVHVNLRKAANLYERGCEGKIAHACARLAAAYQDADWRGRDRKRSRELENRACDLGDTESCRSVGR